MKEKSISDVVKVDGQGIVFSDDTRIVFSECACICQNMHNKKNLKCFAERDITAQPPYFEFFTSHENIRLLFDYRGVFSKSKNEKAFNDLYFKILDSGFTSFDLS